jgi:very-short-patch-repair endonuclease
MNTASGYTCLRLFNDVITQLQQLLNQIAKEKKMMTTH